MSSPAKAGQNGILASKFPGYLCMKLLPFRNTAQKRNAGLFKKQYFLKEKKYFKERIPPNFTKCWLSLSFIPHNLSPQAYLCFLYYYNNYEL